MLIDFPEARYKFYCEAEPVISFNQPCIWLEFQAIMLTQPVWRKLKSPLGETVYYPR